MDYNGDSEYSKWVPVRVDGASEEEVAVYPNPAVNGEVTVDAMRGWISVFITDMDGRKVLETHDVNAGKINVARLPKGLYMVHVATEESEVLKKIVIQ